ncbi:hypothetical protein V5P93_005625 [Actinokineospora auranticolor]|uniref:Uncharacterized protein n=1 Tax=Actinokineospora auranticolor TaxID=155976 RepID=A0A2S6GQA1_9PSEU|nr:hypothetical protein [Actinokineospora auranticolor]PPK67343.1 hypothetical protein CLV40_1076 [Actinokineospora auranticolor]
MSGPRTSTTRPRRGVVPLVSGAAVVVLLAAAAQGGIAGPLLRAAGLVADEPAYTELAFVDPDRLGTRLAATGGLVDSTFAIHNHEGTDTTYPWSVVLRDGERVEVIADGERTVPAGTGVTVPVSVALTCPSHARVEVRVAVPARSIDFLAPCPQGER